MGLRDTNRGRIGAPPGPPSGARRAATPRWVVFAALAPGSCVKVAVCAGALASALLTGAERALGAPEPGARTTSIVVTRQYINLHTNTFC